MANDVFANGREVSCKKADGKTICEFPDVCMTPPENPATPPGVPVPYPNTARAKDTTKGSKNVKISGQEVMLKNKSYFKTSTGDEAGSAAKKGVITSTNKGKAYFISWSPNVKFEGENVVRHLDMTTNNHASPVANGAVPWPEIDTVAPPGLIPKPCKKDCPKEPTKAQSKELRKSTPSDAIVKQVNEKHKTCPVCGNPPTGRYKNLAADHIVPKKIIEKMPGFACLSKDDQEEILNTPENYVGLCVPCNSSKNAKLWHRWKVVKSKGKVRVNLEEGDLAKLREDGRKVTNKSIKNLKNKIKSKPCK